MRLKITPTEIFANNLNETEYKRLNRIASKIAEAHGASRSTIKEKIQGFMVYSSSYETRNHRGYCFQVGHPHADGRNIHAHDEFYIPILNELRKMGMTK